jgi:hypothetical protein
MPKTVNPADWDPDAPPDNGCYEFHVLVPDTTTVAIPAPPPHPVTVR